MKVVLALVLLGLAVALINADKTPSSECYTKSDGADYRGHEQWTEKGRLCQFWVNQSPHQHSRTPSNFKGVGLGTHGFCRNPDGMSRPWCYTQDSGKRWEYCNVAPARASCPGADCENVKTELECYKVSSSCDLNVFGAEVQRDCPKTCGTCPSKRAAGKREDILEGLLRRYLESRETMAEEEGREIH